MFEKLEKVQINGKEYPIRCDINVMIVIQDEFKSLNKFEMDILGLEVVVDKDGKPKKDEKDEVLFYKKDPSIKAIKEILPCMIHEGVEAFKEDGIEMDISTLDEDIKSMRFDYKKVAISIHNEFSKCLVRKNESSAKTQRAKTMKK